jgi:hypothetical protein
MKHAGCPEAVKAFIREMTEPALNGTIYRKNEKFVKAEFRSDYAAAHRSMKQDLREYLYEVDQALKGGDYYEALGMAHSGFMDYYATLGTYWDFE